MTVWRWGLIVVAFAVVWAALHQPTVPAPKVSSWTVTGEVWV
jgi:hypothetical protein